MRRLVRNCTVRIHLYAGVFTFLDHIRRLLIFSITTKIVENYLCLDRITGRTCTFCNHLYCPPPPPNWVEIQIVFPLCQCWCFYFLGAYYTAAYLFKHNRKLQKSTFVKIGLQEGHVHFVIIYYAPAPLIIIPSTKIAQMVPIC